jgi:hypothetical protein
LSIYKDAKDERAVVITQFVQESERLEFLGGRFASPFISGKKANSTPSDAKNALLENLIDQSHALDAVRIYLKPKNVPLVEQYQSELMKLRDALNSVETNGLDQFYDVAETLVRDRDILIFKLDPSKLPSAANTPSTPGSPGGPARPP